MATDTGGAEVEDLGEDLASEMPSQQTVTPKDIIVEIPEDQPTTVEVEDLGEDLASEMSSQQTGKLKDIKGEILEDQPTTTGPLVPVTGYTSQHSTLPDVLSALQLPTVSTVLYKDRTIFENPVPTMSAAFEAIKSRTANMLGAFVLSEYVETRAIKAARQCLYNRGKVVIEGKPSSGRTSLALYISKNILKKSKKGSIVPLYITDIKDIKHLPVRQGKEKVPTILIITETITCDTLAKTELLRDLLKKVDEGAVLLIAVTSPKELRSIRNETVHANILDRRYRQNLADFPLLGHERYEILQCHKHRFRGLPKDDCLREAMFQESAVSADNPWFLHALDECKNHFVKDRWAFFLNPVELLCKQFREMAKNDPKSFAVLIIIMKNELLYESASKSPTSPNSSSMDTIYNLKDWLGIHNLQWRDLQEAALLMKDIYLKFNSSDKSYRFYNGAVGEAVARTALQQLPDRVWVIQNCPLDFLIHHTDIGSSVSVMSGKLMLEDEDEWDALKNRLLAADVNNALRHPAFSNQQFVHKIMREFKSKIDKEQQQYHKICLASIELGHQPVVTEIVTNVLPTLADRGTLIKAKGLEKACEVGNLDAYKILTKTGVKPTHKCMEACSYGRNPKIIQHIIQSFDGDFYLLSHDVLREWFSVVASCRESAPAMSLIRNIQGRHDKDQFLFQLLEKVCRSGHTEMFKAVKEVVSIKHLDLNRIFLSSFEGGEMDIIEELIGECQNPDLNEAFRRACQNNNVDAVGSLLKKYQDLNVRSSCPDALHLTAAVDHKDSPATLLSLLKTRLWDVDAPDDQGRTPLHIACKFGNLKAVKALLENGCSVHSRDKNSNTPLILHLSGNFISKPVVTQMTEKGANDQDLNDEHQNILHVLCRKPVPTLHLNILTDMTRSEEVVNQRDSQGKTPLHRLISSSGPLEAINILLQKADLRLKDNQGQTPLHLACTVASDDVVKLLIDQLKGNQRKYLGYNFLTDCDSESQTPLHCYCKRAGNIMIAKHLLCKDLISLGDSSGSTPLHNAVKIPHNLAVVKMLHEASPKHVIDNQGRFPVHNLCAEAHATSHETLHQLDSFRHQLNVQDTDGNSLLHLLCMSDGTDVVKLVEYILQEGANVWQKDKKGNTAFHICCSTSCQQSKAVLTLLLSHLNNHDKVQEMLSSGGESENTPLHMACMSLGDFKQDIIQMLIQAGADVTQENALRDSVIAVARRNGQMFPILESLVSKACFAKVSLEDLEQVLTEVFPSSETNSRAHLNKVLQIVAQNDGQSTVSVLNVLIQRGADIESKAEDGSTVILLVAATQGQFTCEIIDFLIASGGDLLTTDYKGETAMHKAAMALSSYSLQLVSFLVERGVSVDSQDNAGNTALHKLFSQRHLPKAYSASMDLLISLGCQVDVMNKEGNTVCDLAKEHGSGMFVKMLHAYCSNCDELNKNTLKHIIRHGVDVNCPDSEGNTVLHKVCMKRVIKVCKNVKILLKLGADKFLKNKEGKLAFDLAKECELDEDVRRLTVTAIPAADEIEQDGEGYMISQPPQRRYVVGRPEWFRESDSWAVPFRQNVQTLRNAVGLAYFDDDMARFEAESRARLNTHFQRH